MMMANGAMRLGLGGTPKTMAGPIRSIVSMDEMSVSTGSEASPIPESMRLPEPQSFDPNATEPTLQPQREDYQQDRQFHTLHTSLRQQDIVIPAHEPPSPYSPPPASLFSGEEEWPQKSSRKRPPLREVRLIGRANPRDGMNHEHEMQEDILPMSMLGRNALDQRCATSTAAATTSPSRHAASQARTPPSNGHGDSFAALLHSGNNSPHLIPAVVQLKQNLRQSQQSVFLLRQENESLEAQCDRFQEQWQAWKEELAAERQQVQDQQETLQLEVDGLQADKATLELQHHESRAALEEKERALENLEGQMETVQQAREELQSANEQATRDAFALREENASLETQVQQLEERAAASEGRVQELTQEYAALQTEADTWRTKLQQTTAKCAQTVQEAQARAAEREAALQKELQSQLLEMDRLKAIIKELERSLAQQRAAAANDCDVLQEEVHRLEATLRDKDLVLDQAAAEAEATTAQLQEQVDDLLQENEMQANEAQTKVDILQKKVEQLQDTLHENHSLLTSLQEELNTAQESARGTEERADEAESQAKELRYKVDLLTETLDETKGKVQSLIAEKLALRKDLIQMQRPLDSPSTVFPLHADANNAEELQGGTEKATSFVCEEGATPAEEKENMSTNASPMVQASNGHMRLLAAAASKRLSQSTGRLLPVPQKAIRQEAEDQSEGEDDNEEEEEVVQSNHEAQPRVSRVESEANVRMLVQNEIEKCTGALLQQVEAAFDAKIESLEQRRQAEMTNLREEFLKKRYELDPNPSPGATDSPTKSPRPLERGVLATGGSRTQEETIAKPVASVAEPVTTLGEHDLTYALHSPEVSRQKKWRCRTNKRIEKIRREVNEIFVSNRIRTPRPSRSTLPMEIFEAQENLSDEMPDLARSVSSSSFDDAAHSVFSTNLNQTLDATDALDALVTSFVGGE